jgi:hypothetical protein
LVKRSGSQLNELRLYIHPSSLLCLKKYSRSFWLLKCLELRGTVVHCDQELWCWEWASSRGGSVLPPESHSPDLLICLFSLPNSSSCHVGLSQR